jgi:hypothetical protein
MRSLRFVAMGVALSALAFFAAAAMQAPEAQHVVASATPARVETRLGELTFADGVPTGQTVDKVYDNLDRARAEQAFLNALQGVSMYAAREGFLKAGVADGNVLVFSTLMDGQSLFLTANADTPYFLSFIDLTKGPVVVETPPQALGTFDDMWFHWVIDFGLPGPDRGEGGKYLLVPPDFHGELPASGFNVAHARTTHVLLLGRSFLHDNDPRPAVATIKRTLKIYPYTPGGYGTPVAAALAGKAKLAAVVAEPPSPRFVEGSGLPIDTLPPNDVSYYEKLDRLVQLEPAQAMDAEVMGQLAAIGIVKGKPFDPDTRMRQILEESVAVANATARTLLYRPRNAAWSYYSGSAWINMLWQGGYTFETPPPTVTANGIEPTPPTGARTLDARTAFFYYATGVTPAMIMPVRDIGSQYLAAFVDASKHAFDGARTYRVTLPANIPAGKFWSVTLYDNQTRSMLQTPQRYPRAGSQAYPTPAAVPGSNGATVIYFAPERPGSVPSGNWIQTIPGKGYSAMLRFYSPRDAFFTKTWRPSEVELVR